MKLSRWFLVLQFAGLNFIYSNEVQGQRDCMSLDPTSMEARFLNGKWHVMSTSVGRTVQTLPFKEDADKMIAIIQHYGLNRSCYLGRPDPSMEYWLKGNSAPSGAYRGEDCFQFDVRQLTIVRHPSRKGFCMLSCGDIGLIEFRSRWEATRALNIIRNYGFTHYCRVGSAAGANNLWEYWRK